MQYVESTVWNNLGCPRVGSCAYNMVCESPRGPSKQNVLLRYLPLQSWKFVSLQRNSRPDLNPLEDKSTLKPLSLISVCLRVGSHSRAKTHGDGGRGGEGMRKRRCREKDRMGDIEHRIYLGSAHRVNSPNLMTESN